MIESMKNIGSIVLSATLISLFIIIQALLTFGVPLAVIYIALKLGRVL